jgi:hypothetical protein
MKQTSTCVGDLPKKLATWDKTKTQSLGSQRVGPKSEQPRITGLNIS